MARTTEYISISEGAEIKGVTPQTVRAWIKQGKVKGVYKGKRWKVDPDTLAEYEVDTSRQSNGNGHVDTVDAPAEDEVDEILGEMSALVKRLRSSMKRHDAKIRREAIAELGRSLAESVT